jgi:predicted GIY-YIG superfamily endonuclease
MPTAFIYMLRCRDTSLYTGITYDVQRRLRQHSAGKGARYTATRLPVCLVWQCEVSSWAEAMREERRIKHLSRAAKLELVKAGRRQRRNTGTPR